MTSWDETFILSEDKMIVCYKVNKVSQTDEGVLSFYNFGRFDKFQTVIL